MGRKHKGYKIDGWINLDKPEGLTSTQAIGRVRRILNPRKIGHAGTLDPLATGVLPLALGEATKTVSFMQDALKTYIFTVTWGEERDTHDSEGKVTARNEKRPALKEIESLLSRYIGNIQQLPPRYSALKVKGKRAYDLARAGKEVALEPRMVFIESLEIRPPKAEGGLDEGAQAAASLTSFLMTCGKGTYVRALARDLGRDLGCFGYVSALRRLKVGTFDVKKAISLDKLEKMSHSAALKMAVLPLQAGLDDIPALSLKKDEAARLRNGQTLAFVSRPDFERLAQAGLDRQDSRIVLAMTDGSPVALIKAEGPKVKPVKVFNL